MQNTTALGSGGLIFATWVRMPRALRFSIGAGICVMAGAELNVLLNQSTYSGQLARGQAGQAVAAVENPKTVVGRYRTDLPVTSAGLTAAADAIGREAQSRQQGAEAAAAVATTQNLNDRYRQGDTLTATEDLKRLQIATAEQELRAKTAIADKEASAAIIERAKASAAGAQASADIASSHFVNTILGSPGNPASLHDVVDNAMNSTVGGLGPSYGQGNGMLGVLTSQRRAMSRR